MPAPAAARPDLYAALREQQLRIEAERRRLEEARAQAAALRNGAHAKAHAGAKSRRRAAADSEHAATARGSAPAYLRGQLRDPAAFKRAIVMREVLGPPVSLQAHSR